jgi:hypothetical protein
VFSFVARGTALVDFRELFIAPLTIVSLALIIHLWFSDAQLLITDALAIRRDNRLRDLEEDR